MGIKLIVSDVDGTLIDGTEKTGESFDRLSKIIFDNRLPFTLASGRCYSELIRFKNGLNISLPIIFNNGAAARNNKEFLWQNAMESMIIKPAIIRANELDMVIISSEGDSETAYRHNEYIQNQIDRFGRYNRFYIPLEHEWKDLKIQKVLFTDPQKNGRIDEVLSLLAPYKEQLNIVRYNARSADVMAKNSSKAIATLELAKYMNISLSEVMAIGDSMNDIEMLREVGLGVAVANADDELKLGADYVCENDNVDGVIEAIERFILE